MWSFCKTETAVNIAEHWQRVNLIKHPNHLFKKTSLKTEDTGHHGRTGRAATAGQRAEEQAAGCTRNLDGKCWQAPSLFDLA